MSTLPPAVLTAPADRRMIASMQKITGLTWAAKEVTRRRYEKFTRLALLGGGTEVTAAAFPRLREMVDDICAGLNIVSPDFFLVNRTDAAVTVGGEEHPILTVTTAALQTFSPDVLRLALAQTLTHIHCGHLPYLAMRSLAAAAADNLGILKSAVSLPRMLLEEWFFASEISGDRGALWISGDLTAVLQTLCAEALPENPYGRLTPEMLLAQGERYLELWKNTPPCPLFHTWANLYFNLPRYALRAVELKKWAESDEYRNYRSGRFSADKQADESDTAAPAYWGAFADGENPWESVAAAAETEAADDETADFLFGLNRREWLTSCARSAEAFARTGARAFGAAATAFLKAWK